MAEMEVHHILEAVEEGGILQGPVLMEQVVEGLIQGPADQLAGAMVAEVVITEVAAEVLEEGVVIVEVPEDHSTDVPEVEGDLTILAQARRTLPEFAVVTDRSLSPINIK
jgi:hypothetical protein